MKRWKINWNRNQNSENNPAGGYKTRKTTLKLEKNTSRELRNCLHDEWHEKKNMKINSNEMENQEKIKKKIFIIKSKKKKKKQEQKFYEETDILPIKYEQSRQDEEIYCKNCQDFSNDSSIIMQ